MTDWRWSELDEPHTVRWRYTARDPEPIPFHDDYNCGLCIAVDYEIEQRHAAGEIPPPRPLPGPDLDSLHRMAARIESDALAKIERRSRR